MTEQTKDLMMSVAPAPDISPNPLASATDEEEKLITSLYSTMAPEIYTKQLRLIRAFVQNEVAPYKKRLEEQTLLLPEGSRTIRNGFTKVKRLMGSTGVMRFDAERTDAGHADEFWAAMLAVSAAGGAAGYQSMADFGAIGGRTVLGNFTGRQF